MTAKASPSPRCAAARTPSSIASGTRPSRKGKRRTGTAGGTAPARRHPCESDYDRSGDPVQSVVRAAVPAVVVALIVAGLGALAAVIGGLGALAAVVAGLVALVVVVARLGALAGLVTGLVLLGV